MLRWVWLVTLVVACGGVQGDAKTTSTSSPNSNWHPSTGDEGSALAIRIDPGTPWKDAATKILGDMCPDAVLVWGDLVVDESVHARSVLVEYDGGKLKGWLVCSAYMEAFLKLQTMNPRIKAGHGGSGDLKWRDDQLWLRRRWSAADIALGQLDPPPENVFQRGEALAALVAVEAANPKTESMLSALARAPRVFVFAMFPLR
jgi:hypothetical protein